MAGLTNYRNSWACYGQVRRPSDGMSKAQLTHERDVYIEYDYEQVMFRWDAACQKIYRKFYGKDEYPIPIQHSNTLFHDALSFGSEITKDRYFQKMKM